LSPRCLTRHARASLSGRAITVTAPLNLTVTAPLNRIATVTITVTAVA